MRADIDQINSDLKLVSMWPDINMFKLDVNKYTVINTLQENVTLGQSLRDSCVM